MWLLSFARFTRFTMAKFYVGQRVIAQTLGCAPETGYIHESWVGSAPERASGRYGLDKWCVKLDNGNSLWLYSSDIKP